MSKDAGPKPRSSAPGVAICIDDDALWRLRPVMRHLCVGLVDEGFRVRVLSSSPEAETLEFLGPVQLLRHERMVWPMKRWRFPRLAQSLAEHKPDICFGVGWASFGLSAELAATFEADFLAWVTSSEDVDWLRREDTPKPAHFIAASDPLHERLVDRGVAGEAAVSLIRPGVTRGKNVSCFVDEESVASLICPAPMKPGLGLELVIDAVERVRDGGAAVMTFFCNSGPHEPKLRQIVAAKGLSANVTFARASAELVDVLRGADMMIVAPGERAVSARPLQAMANGTVVIVCAHGSADSFHHLKTAWVCADESPEALAEAVLYLVANRDQARALAQSAHDYILQHHQVSEMAARIASALRRVLLRRQSIPMRR